MEGECACDVVLHISHILYKCVFFLQGGCERQPQQQHLESNPYSQSGVAITHLDIKFNNEIISNIKFVVIGSNEISRLSRNSHMNDGMCKCD